jgi:hypothetical protein
MLLSPSVGSDVGSVPRFRELAPARVRTATFALG